MSACAHPLICICGPTASGKTEVSELVAANLGAQIVSVDAMQVYRGMDIGTAKLPESERRVALHMVDVCEPNVDYSVQMFQRDARACIDVLLRDGTPVVLCGGTGLYLNAVIDDMSFPAGERASDVRRRYERYLEEKGAQELFALLEERDPESARIIHPNNTRRVVRALEMLDEGSSYAVHHEGLHQRKPHYNAMLFALDWPREVLYERIDKRVDAMFASGLVDEVRGLVEKGFVADSTAGQAIGYKEVLSYLEGTMTLDEAQANVKQRTRRYAKRQISWFRHDERSRWIDMSHMTPEEAAQTIVQAAKEQNGS